jgi:TP901 family phage tail tape measure protein
LGGTGGGRALNSLSQPLGRLTGQADEFTKSLDAANARVLAFGASVGVLNAITNAFKAMVNTTIEVEKTLTAINVVFGKSSTEIKDFGKGIFQVAKQTGQSFQEVSRAALEFSRQGLTLEDTLVRTKDALVLTRLTGLDTAKAVQGLTATINSFSKEALTSGEIINKLASVDQKFSVSAADLTEALSRSASVAQNAGVNFDELIGIITSLQERTARGGAVIGNSIKTIFTRIQRPEVLEDLKNLGVAIQDVDTKQILSASQILKNLAGNIGALGQIQKSGIFEEVAGGFQINQLQSLLSDLAGSESTVAKARQVSTAATNEAYLANEKLNKTISALINNSVEGLKELGATLGDLGIADSIKSALGVVNGFIQDVQTLLGGDGPGAKFAQGIVKGIGSVLSGPGVALFGVVITKLIYDLGRFAVQGLKTFVGVGQAAREQRALQEAIVITLSRNSALQAQIAKFQGNAVAQASVLAGIYNQQEASLRRQNAIAAGMASTLYASGMRAGPQGFSQTGRAAGGYLPSAEAADVSRGVGGASPSAQVVTIPNFAFGNGKRGTMVANTSEYIVPNYANGGSAIFNQEMVRSMGLPAGAKKIRAAGGYVPNFARKPIETSGNYSIDPERGTKKQNEIDTAKYQTKNGPNLVIDAQRDLGGIGMMTVGGNSKAGAKPYYFDVDDNKLPISSIANLQGINKKPLDKAKIVVKNIQGSNGLAALNYGKDINDIHANFSNDLGKALMPPIVALANKIFGIPLTEAHAQKLSIKDDFLSPSAEGSIFQEMIALANDSFTNENTAFKGEDNRSFDFNAKGPASSKFLEKFFINGGSLFKVDAKRTDTADARRGMVKKIFNDGETFQRLLQRRKDIRKDLLNNEPLTFGVGSDTIRKFDNKGKLLDFDFETGKEGRLKKMLADSRAARAAKASKGYIPNFANKALTDSINRERVQSGLPMSAISVTQDSRLMNSRNPTGLAVINSRDEPNGKIPNFANTPANNPPANDATAKGIGDLAAKFLILQTSLSFLQGGFTEAGSTSEKLAKGLQTLTMAFFAYQLVQGSATKTASANNGLLKQAGDALKKFASDIKGPGVAAKTQMALNLRNNPLTSSLSAANYKPSLGDKLSDSLRGSRLGEGTRSVLGGGAKVLGDPGAALSSVVGVLGPLGKGLATAAIGLKAFNDIAALFYKRSSGLDSSLSLLSSAATKASAALTDLDKSVLMGVVSKSRNTGFGATVDRAITSQLGLGKDAVSFGVGEGVLTSNLKGGQTSEDFNKVREELSMLLINDIRSTNPGFTSEELQKEASSQLEILLGSGIDRSTLTLDLEKVINLDLVQDIMKGASDAAVKVQRINDETASKKAFPKLVESIEAILNNTSTVFNDEINRMNSFSEQIKAIQSSKAFGNLEAERQLSTNLVASSKEFQDSFRKRQIDIIKNAQNSIRDSLPAIVEKEDFGKGEELAAQLQDATSIEEVSIILQQFSDALKGIDPTKVKSFSKVITDAKNTIATFNSDISTRTKTLALEQQELIATTQAQIEFRNKFVSFTDSIGIASRALVALKGDLERIDIETQSNIDIRSISSTSRQQDLDIKREETLRGLSRKQGVQSTIDVKEAMIEARKQAFTQENLIALNSNTEAIRILTQSILQETGIDFQQKYDETLKAFNEKVDRYMGEGKSSTEATAMASGALVDGKGGLTYGQQLAYYQNALKLNNTTQNGLAGSIQASNQGDSITAILADENKMLELVRSAGSMQEYLNKVRGAFTYTDQAAELMKPILASIYDKLKLSDTVNGESLKTEKERLDALQDLLNATNNYKQALSDNVKSLSTKLATQPMTQGEFLTTQRQLRIAEKERSMENNPEALREYKSSFGRGFAESMTELDAKTLDFKNEIGREIPQLFSSNLAQGLNDAVSGAKSLKDALTDAATSFFNAITKANIENIANRITGGIGGLFTGNKKDNNFFATGGMISGGSGVKDDVPAMLMGGEYVVKKSAVKKYGSNFLDSLNQGKLSGYASGGAVQSGKGGFYAPGEYNQGAITGQSQLLEFATQSRTSGQFDQMSSYGMSGASINLEAESSRLTMAGRENSPIFERTQQAKEEAFQVYLQSLQVDKQYQDQLKEMKEAEKARKKQLVTSIAMAVASSAASYGASAFGTGAENAIAEAGAKATEPLTFMQRLSTGFSGGIKNLGAAFPGGAKPTFQLNDYAQANRLGMSVDVLRANRRNANIVPYRQGYSPRTTRYSGGRVITGGGGNMPLDYTRPINYTDRLLNSSNALADYQVGSRFGSGLGGGLLPKTDWKPDSGPDWKYNANGKANGGPIFGGSGVRDDVPAMLTGGEFVLNNRATRKLGMSNLQRLNSGDTSSQQGSAESSSDLTQALMSKLDELINETKKTSKDNIVVNVSGMDNKGEKNDGAQSANEKDLQKKIKAAVLEVITQEKRLGGSLNK